MAGSDAGEVDLLVRGRLVNVLTGTIEERAVAVDDGAVVGFGERPARETHEAAYVAPGLINGHMHVESTMLSLPRFAEVAVPRGVTGVVTDPHEIANVLGVAGVRELAAHAAHTPLRARFTVPSSVPASDLQDAGARLGPDAVADLLDADRVVGLAEVMDVEGVVGGDPAVHAKIDAARERGLVVDGHMPRVTGRRLDEAARHLDTDHESRAFEEAREKAAAGVRIHLREGSSSSDLAALAPLVDAVDGRRLMLCTDNLYVDDLRDRGGIDGVVRRAIDLGVDPVEAVQMATINVAETYGLPFGRIKPGAPADLVLLSELETWDVDRVVVDGVVDPVAGAPAPPTYELDHNSVHLDPVDPADLARSVPAESGSGRRNGGGDRDGSGDGNGERETRTVRVIDHTGAVTVEDRGEVPVVDGRLGPNPDSDLLSAAVIERHGGDGGVGVGFVHGFGLDRGALASTVAHDAHNLVVVGADYAAMARAANELRAVGGGLTVVDPDAGTTTLPLPVGGLVSQEPAGAVARQYAAVEAAARAIGTALPKGIMALDNLSLEVVPEIRLTNRGLVDVERMEHVDLLV